MILYFADRLMNIIGTASTNLPKGIVIIDDSKTEDVDSGASAFECELSFDEHTRAKLEEITEVGNYLLRSDKGENEFYTIIDCEIDTRQQTAYIYAEDAGLDLLNDIIEPYEANDSYEISHYVERTASDAGWEIGVNELEGITRKLSFDNEQTGTARLLSIAKGFNDCEISFSFEVKGLQIEKKLINIYEQRGKDTDIQLRLNKQIDSIVTRKTINNLATALKPKGSVPADSDKPITLLNYEYPDDGDFYIDGDVLKSREALNNWERFLWKGKDDEQTAGHIVKTFSYDTTSQAVLCEKTIEELKKVRDMEINYEIEINELPESARIGDRVNVIDENGELYLSTRLLKLVTSVTKQSYKATLGESFLKGSGISQKVADLAAQFAINAQSAQKALEVANAAKENADKAKEDAESVAGAVQGAIDAAEKAEEAADKATESANQATGAANAATEAVGRVEQSVSGLQQTIDNANQAAQNAQQAAQTATQKAAEAQTAAGNAQAKAEEATAANSQAQEKAQEALEKAEEATETAGTAKAKAQAAAAIANAAKKDALQAEADIAEWETSLKTVTDTMSAEYSRKTDLTEATESLQSQISRNAGSIKQNVIGITVIDETANNALTTIQAAQKAADEAQTLADEASAIATEAQTAADTANAAATAAQNQADIAQTAYETAKQAADRAEADLKAAEEDLETVAGRVDATEAEIAAAQKLVDDAQAVVDSAKANAKTALATATAAQEVANAAVDTATKAQANADKALNEANIARQFAEEAKGNVTAAQNKVSQAEATAATAKTKADNLKKAAETAQATADQAVLDATAAQVTADKAQEKATKAAEDLATAQQNLADVLANVEATEEAVANAYADVDIAQEKATEAQTYANQAQASANTAKNEATQAQAAADTAKAAADTAQAEAKAAQDEVDKALGLVYSLEKRITTNETGIEQTKDKIRLFATKDEVIQSLGGYYTKEEADSEIAIQTDKISTKVSRTYETKENVKEALGGYYTKEETDAQIDVKAGEITSTVSSSYLAKDDYTQAQSELTEKLSEVTQTASSLDIKFTQKVTETDKEMNTKFNEFYKMINIAENGISIGGGANAMLLTVDNDNGIIFSRGGVPFGWWDGENFHTGNIVVEVNERAQFGNFAYVPRSDGSLSFLKIDGRSTDAHTHSYRETVIQAATCGNPGTKVILCTGCGESRTETIPALDCNFTVTSIKEPTATAQGYTTYTCTGCGASYQGDYTEPTGHVHDYSDVREVEPTCTEQGYTEYTCECGASYKDLYKDARGHNDGNNDGYCDVCGVQTGEFFTITVQSNNTSYGTVVGGGTFLSGSRTIISAEAKPGYRFVQWDDGTTAVSRIITVTGEKTYTAYFEASEQTLALNTTTTVNVAASTVEGKLEQNVPLSDFTFIKFVAPSSGTYTFECTGRTLISTTSSTDTDPTARLYDSTKTNKIAEDDDSAGNSNFKIEKQLEAGTYYLAVKFYRVGITGTMNIKVSSNSSSGGGSTKEITIYSDSNGKLRVDRNGSNLTNDTREDFKYLFNVGDEVTLTFTPDSGYSFYDWWNAETYDSISNANPYTFTVGDTTPTQIGIGIMTGG